MMHRIVLGLLSFFLLMSCSKQAEIAVMNLSEIDRQDELVEVCLCELEQLDPAKLIVLDSLGNQLPVQFLYKGEKTPQSIVFPVTVKAGRKVVLTIKEGEPKPLAGHTFAGAVSDGDWMEQALGAGVIAPYSEDSIWTLNRYDRVKVLDKGALRSSFVLYYDSVRYHSHVLTAEVQVTLDKGSYLNETIVRFSGDTAQLRLANGIDISRPSFVRQGNPERGYVGVASDSACVGLVFLSRLAEMKEIGSQLTCISHYMQGESFRYFAGTARIKTDFPSGQDWFNYLSIQQKAKSNPLDIKIDR